MCNSVFLEPGFELFLNRVFGKNRFHGASGNRDKDSWKKILTKLFTSLEKHIEANIQDDPEQIQDLKRILELIKDTLDRNESVNELNIDTIRTLFEICFQLLGDEIDNTDKKIVNHSSHYKLDRKRTLVYHSNNFQKFWKIHSRAGSAKFLDAGFPNQDKLENLFFYDMNKNPDKFIKWFKTEYPDLYLDMF